MIDQSPMPLLVAPTRFEPVVVTSSRLDQFHEAAHLALAETIQEFVRLDGKSVDAARWRFLRSRDGVSVYGDRHPTSRHSPLLVAGTIKARLDDVMEGLCMDNSDDTRSTLHRLSSRFLDAEVLKVIERGSAQNPHAFTGLKWSMVRSSSGVVSKRDICYFEKRGTINVSGNRKLGYFIMQSVNLPECPPPTSRKIVRADISLCYLFEELGDGIVGLYMRGNLMNHGPRMLWKMARNSFADIVLAMGRAADSAHTKRYTSLMKAKLRTRVRTKTVAIACEVCRSLPFIFDHHYACAGCNKTSVCKKCRTKCEVFDLDHDPTRTVTATFCAHCVERVRSPPQLAASVVVPQSPVKPISSDVKAHCDEVNCAPHKQSFEARFTDCEYDAYRNSAQEEPVDETTESRRSLQEFSLKLTNHLDEVGFSKSNSGLRLSDLEMLGAGHKPDPASNDDDSLEDVLSDSQRSLREFEIRLLQQVEDSGYNNADPNLRLSDLESLGIGSSRTYGGAAEYTDDECEVDAVSTRTVSVGEDEPSWEEDEVVAIHPLRRSTQPPEMLEMQTLNMDGSIRRRHAHSDPESRPRDDHEQAMMSRLVKASIAAEQTLQLTKEQSRRANHIFAASRSRSLEKRQLAEVHPVQEDFLDMLD